MALFTIGDLHLALGTDKPMDIFSGWQDYVQRLVENWRRLVTKDDTVVLPGDTSWAMHLADTAADFAFLQALPGKKIIGKGNHDYWWGTLKKMQAFCEQQGFNTISFLHNNCYLESGMAICGTRGWLFETGEELDAKVMQREVGRLAASLQAAQAQYPGAEKLVFLHYPPLYRNASSPQILALLQEYGVKRCFYGHLHGESVQWAVQGVRDGVSYRLISADGLGFCPLAVEPAG